jgi:cell division protein FtsB
MENAIDLESLSREFQFVELGRQVADFVSQHPHTEVVRLKSAMLDLQRQIAGQNRELCQLAEANGRWRAERDSQLACLREAIDEVAKKQRHEREKVSGVQEVMGEVRRQIEGVTIKLSETHTAVERTETKDRTSRVESDVAGLRAAMADWSAKVEEVRREVPRLKVQLSDCCPKVKRDLTNLEQEVAKLKEETGAMRPKPEPLAPPVADGAVPPAPKAVAPAQKCSSSSSAPPSDVTAPPPKPAPVKASPTPAPPERAKRFAPSVKKGKYGFDVPDGIVHDYHVVDVTCGSFEKETHGAIYAAHNAADLKIDSCFYSAYHLGSIPHTRNNWLCYDFKERRIVPTHYTIRTCSSGAGGCHLKSWLVDTSADGETWREVAREENNE